MVWFENKKKIGLREKCYGKYVDYEMNSPRKVSLCNSCPFPDLPERDVKVSKNK